MPATRSLGTEQDRRRASGTRGVARVARRDRRVRLAGDPWRRGPGDRRQGRRGEGRPLGDPTRPHPADRLDRGGADLPGLFRGGIGAKNARHRDRTRRCHRRRRQYDAPCGPRTRLRPQRRSGPCRLLGAGRAGIRPRRQTRRRRHPARHVIQFRRRYGKPAQPGAAAKDQAAVGAAGRTPMSFEEKKPRRPAQASQVARKAQSAAGITSGTPARWCRCRLPRPAARRHGPP
jgi:hypothetical protein